MSNWILKKTTTKKTYYLKFELKANLNFKFKKKNKNLLDMHVSHKS